MMRAGQGSVSRARWAAVGAAVAVSLGVGGVAVTNAVVSTGEKDAFVPISPCRLFDLRPAPSQVGPRAAPLVDGETYTQSVTGTNGNCTIPSDATAVAMNVTAVGGTASSFLTIWPSDVTPRPLASNLNWAPGAPPTPNKVDVKLSADGKINLFNLSGTVSVLGDVVGYYADHNHDDRYYTKAEIDTKLSSAVVMANDVLMVGNTGALPTSVEYFTGRSRVNGGAGATEVSVDGPKTQSGIAFGLKSLTYCMEKSGAAFITTVSIIGSSPFDSASDSTARSVNGCYTLTANIALSTSFILTFTFAGGSGFVDFTSITSTWAPVSLLPTEALPTEGVPTLETGPASGL
jgi:hypothetical protein